MSIISKKTRVSGATGSGTHHFISMKLTSIALIPLTIWALVAFVCFIYNPIITFVDFIHMPFNTIMAILFSGFCMHHGAQGMQMIIEDYVKNPFLKQFGILKTYLIAIATFIAFVVAIFHS